MSVGWKEDGRTEGLLSNAHAGVMERKREGGGGRERGGKANGAPGQETRGDRIERATYVVCVCV